MRDYVQRCLEILENPVEEWGTPGTGKDRMLEALLGLKRRGEGMERSGRPCRTGAPTVQSSYCQKQGGGGDWETKRINSPTFLFFHQNLLIVPNRSSRTRKARRVCGPLPGGQRRRKEGNEFRQQMKNSQYGLLGWQFASSLCVCYINELTMVPVGWPLRCVLIHRIVSSAPASTRLKCLHVQLFLIQLK